MNEFPKLFVTDLDGTALGGGYEPYARFPDHFSEFLDKLDSKGCRWAINTTWDPNGQWQLVLGSSVKSRPAFLMGEMGYRLATVKDEKMEMIQPYTESVREKILETNNKHLHPLIKDICSKFTPEIIHFYGHLFQFNAIEEDKERLIEYTHKNYPENGILKTSCNKGTLVSYPAVLEKSLNLSEALKLSGISPEHVVIAGDEIADTAMMRPELAAFAVCPENANPKVKEHVISRGGEVGDAHSGSGIIDAFNRLAEKNKWDWE